MCCLPTAPYPPSAPPAKCLQGLEPAPAPHSGPASHPVADGTAGGDSVGAGDPDPGACNFLLARCAGVEADQLEVQVTLQFSCCNSGRVNEQYPAGTTVQQFSTPTATSTPHPLTLPAVRMLASLCGTPMLLWLPAAALTSHHDFRLIHMAVPPAEAAAAAAAAEPKLSSSGATGAEESVAAAEPATGEPAGSKKED